MTNKPILALTLYQPWASLIVWGEKHYETRSWGTPYRGPLVIHASVNRDELKRIAEFMYREPDDLMVQTLRVHGINNPNDLPLGAAIGICDLVDCLRIDDALAEQQTMRERRFGWWQSGRYALKVANVRAFKELISARGAQKFWPWTGPIPVSTREGH